MTSALYYNVILLVYLAVASSDNINEYIMTQFCSQTSRTIKGHGAVLRYDGILPQPENYTILRDTLLDCSITFEVDPEGFYGLAVMSAVHFKSDFRIASPGFAGSGTSRDACPDAFLELYDPHDAKRPLWTMCSDEEAPTGYESKSEKIKLRLFANFTIPHNVSDPDDSDLYPEVYFNADFTTYAPDCAIDKFPNLMKCEESKRCIHNDVKCDRFASLNCWSPSGGPDISDQISGSPAYCYDDPLAHLLPLWVILGLLGAALLAGILYWLFWRPGWCIWRLARIRNFRFCFKCCKRGRCGNWCSKSKLCNCCKSGSKYPQKFSSENATGATTFKNVNGSKSVWTRFYAGDGFHLSESRY